MRLIYIVVFFISQLMVGQTDIPSLQKEIDTTVWRPFQNAFEALDAQALNDLYAKDVLRVTPDGIDTKNQFKRGNFQSFEASKLNETQIVLDFWLDSRKTTEDTSYEVGFFRIRITPKSTAPVYSYGQFHIVLKKIDSSWKITQDWDDTIVNGKTLTAEDFARKEVRRF